MIDFTCLSPL